MRDHMDAVDVSDPGTGIGFSPATKFVHVSGQAVQALGSGITLSSALKSAHKYGAPINGIGFKSGGYRGKNLAKPVVWRFFVGKFRFDCFDGCQWKSHG